MAEEEERQGELQEPLLQSGPEPSALVEVEKITMTSATTTSKMAEEEERQEELQEPLLQSAPEPSAPPSQTIQVVAPSNLQEGYQFDAIVNGQTFSVTVPEGGVRQGETFDVPYTLLGEDASENPTLLTAEVVEAPTSTIPHASRVEGQAANGRWKDGLCSCCAHGCCHSSLCCALFLPSVAISQVMRRFNLSIMGQPVTNTKSKTTFFFVFLLTIAFHVFHTYYMTQILEASTGMLHVAIIYIPTMFFLFTVLLVANTRRYIRRRDNISEKNCVGCEDCCVAIFCTCNTISQMARHTTDYDTYRAPCCSQTGLPARALPTPEVV